MLALCGAAGALRGREMAKTIEPDVPEGGTEGGVFEEFDDAADVVGVDVRDDQQLEAAMRRRERRDALTQGAKRPRGAAVNEYPVGGGGGAVLDPEAVTVLGREHVDHEHRRAR